MAAWGCSVRTLAAIALRIAGKPTTINVTVDEEHRVARVEGYADGEAVTHLLDRDSLADIDRALAAELAP